MAAVMARCSVPLTSRGMLCKMASAAMGHSVCQQCLRTFVTTRTSLAGHNKWSKVKHIKAVMDKKKAAERTEHIRLITLYSRLHGEDVKNNPQLVHAMSAAAKASIPKALVEAAIARGQGRSATGTQLESMTFEALLPPNIALIVDVETDNKNRTLHDLRQVVKKAGAVASSTAFFFSRRGRVVLKSNNGALTLSDLLEEAIEHDGAEDIEELGNGRFLVWTQPSQAMAITKALANKFELEVEESDIIWAANEDTKVALDSTDSSQSLADLLAGLQQYSEVKEVFANVKQGSIPEEEWERIEMHINL
ncbi:hypothetical protein E4U15_003756 [Claviceps sp. LM218 group G6]|nr:hypothetical protein E4U15_003756 [Claviceps sp. LM218 group G6]KAG6120906.1 hypothetical protein E4U14_002957 [Claviceps sp. LM454 group G7]